MKKFTPEKVQQARRRPMIIKWRASNSNGTLVSNPTLKELKERIPYQKTCQSYVRMMLKEIIKKELEMDKDLDLKPAEYYFNRYDVTAVECKILKNEIYSKL